MNNIPQSQEDATELRRRYTTVMNLGMLRCELKLCELRLEKEKVVNTALLTALEDIIELAGVTVEGQHYEECCARVKAARNIIAEAKKIP